MTDNNSYFIISYNPVGKLGSAGWLFLLVYSEVSHAAAVR